MITVAGEHFLVVTSVLVTLEVHLVDTAALGASVVLEVAVEVEVDGVVRVGGVTGAADDTGGPLQVEDTEQKREGSVVGKGSSAESGPALWLRASALADCGCKRLT